MIIREKEFNAATGEETITEREETTAEKKAREKRDKEKRDKKKYNQQVKKKFVNRSMGVFLKSK
jgi:hypothetical protein